MLTWPALYCCVLLLLQLNVVYFKVAGLGLLSGNLSIKASYAVESEQRVSIKFIESTLVSTECGGLLLLSRQG